MSRSQPQGGGSGLAVSVLKRALPETFGPPFALSLIEPRHGPLFSAFGQLSLTTALGMKSDRNHRGAQAVAAATAPDPDVPHD